ncbi:MAG: 3'-5' exonuclease, partial [Gammaproteobacteria bacterium]|nr:3'-5' exonuclease [Gammaproteobacteria bacterium]
EGGRHLYGLDDLTEKEAANVMFYKRRQESRDTELLRPHLHRIVAISAVLHHDDQYEIWTCADKPTEAEKIQAFYALIQQYNPTLVAWNAEEMALPVLRYRSMLHKLVAPIYFEQDDSHLEHQHVVDLSDYLADFYHQARVPLDEFARLLGIPAKPAMDFMHCWHAFRHNDTKNIREHSEWTVLTTYLVYLRYRLFTGEVDQGEYASQCELLKSNLINLSNAHIQDFLASWPE